MSEQQGGIVAGALVKMGRTHYAVDIRAAHHHFTADEPKSAGGGDAGPSPFGLLLSSLGACTASTLRMYTERKSWPLGDIQVQLTYRWEGETPVIERTALPHDGHRAGRATPYEMQNLLSSGVSDLQLGHSMSAP